MSNRYHLRSREEILTALEALYSTIRQEGKLADRGGVVVQLCSLARQLVEDEECEQLQRKLEAVERDYAKKEAANVSITYSDTASAEICA